LSAIAFVALRYMRLSLNVRACGHRTALVIYWLPVGFYPSLPATVLD